MNNNDKLDKQLRELFKELPLENPSPDFMQHVMQLVEKEEARKKRRQKWMPVLLTAAGIVGIFFLPGVIIYLCTQFIPGFSFSFGFPTMDIKISLPVVSIALAVFFLLVTDSLFRKHRLKKKIKELWKE